MDCLEWDKGGTEVGQRRRSRLTPAWDPGGQSSQHGPYRRCSAEMLQGALSVPLLPVMLWGDGRFIEEDGANLCHAKPHPPPAVTRPKCYPAGSLRGCASRRHTGCVSFLLSLVNMPFRHMKMTTKLSLLAYLKGINRNKMHSRCCSQVSLTNHPNK